MKASRIVNDVVRCGHDIEFKDGCVNECDRLIRKARIIVAPGDCGFGEVDRIDNALLTRHVDGVPSVPAAEFEHATGL